MQPIIRNTRFLLLNVWYRLSFIFGIIAPVGASSLGSRFYTRGKNNALLGSIFFEVEFSV